MEQGESGAVMTDLVGGTGHKGQDSRGAGHWDAGLELRLVEQEAESWQGDDRQLRPRASHWLYFITLGRGGLGDAV